MDCLIATLRDISLQAQHVLNEGSLNGIKRRPLPKAAKIPDLHLPIPDIRSDLHPFALKLEGEDALKAQFQEACIQIRLSVNKRYEMCCHASSFTQYDLLRVGKVFEGQFQKYITQTRQDLLSSISRSCLRRNVIYIPFTHEQKATPPSPPYTPSTKRLKRTNEQRRVFTPEAEKVLEDTFAKQSSIKGQAKKDLAAKLGVAPEKVAIWFQNARARRTTPTKQANKRSVSSSSIDSDQSRRSISPCPSLASSTSSSSTASSPEPSLLPEVNPFIANSHPFSTQPDFFQLLQKAEPVSTFPTTYLPLQSTLPVTADSQVQFCLPHTSEPTIINPDQGAIETFSSFQPIDLNSSFFQLPEPTPLDDSDPQYLQALLSNMASSQESLLSEDVSFEQEWANLGSLFQFDGDMKSF